MKNLVVILILIVPLQIFSQGIEFEHRTLDEVKLKAKKENKLIFIDFYTDWCAPCKMLVKDVFPTKEVGDFYNKYFISYKIDAEKGKGVEIAKKHKINAFPTLLFINSDGKELHRTAGAKPSLTYFIGIGKTALNPEKRLSALDEKYANGNRDIKFVKNYFSTLNGASIDIESKLYHYASSLSTKELITEEIYNLISTYANNPNSETFNILLDNKKAYNKLIGKKEVEGKMYSVFLQSYINNNMYKKGKGNDKIINTVKMNNFGFADKLTAEAEVMALVHNRKIDDYFTKAEEFINKYAPNDAVMLSKFARYGKSAKDKKLQQKTISWIEKAIELGENDYITYQWYAYLLSLTDNKEKTLEVTNKTIELGKKTGQDTSWCESILKALKEEE